MATATAMATATTTTMATKNKSTKQKKQTKKPRTEKEPEKQRIRITFCNNVQALNYNFIMLLTDKGKAFHRKSICAIPTNNTAQTLLDVIGDTRYKVKLDKITAISLLNNYNKVQKKPVSHFQSENEKRHWLRMLAQFHHALFPDQPAFPEAKTSPPLTLPWKSRKQKKEKEEKETIPSNLNAQTDDNDDDDDNDDNEKNDDNGEDDPLNMKCNTNDSTDILQGGFVLPPVQNPYSLCPTLILGELRRREPLINSWIHQNMPLQNLTLYCDPKAAENVVEYLMNLHDNNRATITQIMRDMMQQRSEVVSGLYW